jgi:epidermal growth factor receptor substrate 15
MYLIQSCMANPALALPAVLPPGTYEAASGGRGPASPIVRQNTGPASPQYRQPTPVRGANWDVTTEAKNTSDRFFEQLDTQNRGYIEGDVAVPFMLQSQLDEGTLAAIWDLADIRKEGKLNKDEFAVAMHLINAKLAGRDPPATLPTSLVPPSLRNEPTQPPQTSAAKDLFDLFADEPIGPSFPSQAPPPPVQTVRSPIQSPQVRSPQIKSPQLQSPQVRSPQADLMGEEDQPIADNSAEIGNKRNQLENTNRGLDSMQKERPGLEKAATSGADELKELEGKLIAARSKHESESKAVAELKARVSEQKDKIQSVNMDYIAAQSDVSALQSERDELEQALLAGKEEVRDLNKRMKEIAEEKAGLLLLLEKLKKETRQQKGMVSIAKKQLATAEGGRDSVQGEIRALEATPEATEAAAVPLPSTPRALSPATSQRSNNPFDRFREGAKSPAGVLGAGALIGAAAGVVVAGAETLYEAAKDVVSPDEAKSEADQVHEFAEHVREPKQATDFDSAFAEYGQEGLPSGIPKSAIPYMRADERSASTQAVRGDSMPESPASTVPGVGESSLRNVADDSSDEDEGPEDVEAIKYRSDNTPILYPPVAQVEAPKSRRSAPPPPPRIVEELDPFGENSEAGEDPASATFDPSGAETVPATVHAQSDLFGASDVARNVPVPTGTAPRENDVFDTVQGVAVKSDSSRAAESAESRATPAGAPLAGETDALGSMQDDGAQSDPFDASLDHVKPETDPVGPAGGQTDPFGALQGTTQSDPFGLPLQGAPAPTKLGFDDDEFASMGQPKSTVEAPAAVGDAGKPEQVLPPGAAPAVKSGFDDDDFDFSDAPPVQMNVPPAPMNAKAPAKDDFDFDDEFEQPSNSDGSKSYEMVSPPSGGLAPPIPQTDAWGMQAPPTQPSSAFSFDDAFGEK